jgi:hypothetical protein
MSNPFPIERDCGCVMDQDSTGLISTKRCAPCEEAFAAKVAEHTRNRNANYSNAMRLSYEMSKQNQRRAT